MLFTCHNRAEHSYKPFEDSIPWDFKIDNLIGCFYIKWVTWNEDSTFPGTGGMIISVRHCLERYSDLNFMKTEISGRHTAAFLISFRDWALSWVRTQKESVTLTYLYLIPQKIGICFWLGWANGKNVSSHTLPYPFLIPADTGCSYTLKRKRITCLLVASFDCITPKMADQPLLGVKLDCRGTLLCPLPAPKSLPGCLWAGGDRFSNLNAGTANISRCWLGDRTRWKCSALEGPTNKTKQGMRILLESCWGFYFCFFQ